MDECKGVFGKLFGHKFVTVLVKSTPPKNIPKISIGSFEGYTDQYRTLMEETRKSTLEFIDNLTEKEYYIVCKRCGYLIDVESEINMD